MRGGHGRLQRRSSMQLVRSHTRSATSLNCLCRRVAHPPRNCPLLYARLHVHACKLPSELRRRRAEIISGTSR